MNDVISFGEGLGGAGSGKSACRGIEADGARARLNVWRNDAKLLPLLGGDIEGGLGDGGRFGVFGDTGEAFQRPAGSTVPFMTFFFPPPKERRKDHSDSN